MASKYGKKASEKVEKVMKEMKAGTLKSGRSGKKVTSRKQAIAIGLSEARAAGGKVPPPKRSSAKRASSQSRQEILMAGNIRLLGIAGCVRRASFNKSALRAAQKLVPEGASLGVIGTVRQSCRKGRGARAMKRRDMPSINEYPRASTSQRRRRLPPAFRAGPLSPSRR